MDVSQQNDAHAVDCMERPEVLVPSEVIQWAEDNDLEIEYLYAVVQYARLTMPGQAVTAMVNLTRWMLENPGELPLSRLEISEIGNLLLFVTDCNLAEENNEELRVVDSRKFEDEE